MSPLTENLCVARCAPDGATYFQTYKAVSQFKRRRSILILVAVFLQHNINSVMYRKEEASDLLNNKLERKSRTEFVNNRVLNNFELCYRGTSFKVQGGVR